MSPTTALRQAITAFRAAREARRHDMHNWYKAEALRRARQRLDAEVGALLRRLPFQVRTVTERAHLALLQDVQLSDGPRVRGQTLCGAPSGRPTVGHPPPCTACLHVAERHALDEPPPLAIDR